MNLGKGYEDDHLPSLPNLLTFICLFIYFGKSGGYLCICIYLTARKKTTNMKLKKTTASFAATTLTHHEDAYRPAVVHHLRNFCRVSGTISFLGTSLAALSLRPTDPGISYPLLSVPIFILNFTI
ncbi:hypothetical protein PS1_047462 [Malus domestica]